MTTRLYMIDLRLAALPPLDALNTEVAINTSNIAVDIAATLLQPLIRNGEHVMKTATLLTFMLAAAAPLTASANVITEWDDIAVKTIQPPGPVAPINGDLTFRASALVEVAMFNAVDCIEPKYHLYGMQVEPSPDTSQDAAAATAAATVLMKLVPNSNVKQQLADYLARIPDGPAKDRGIKVGQDAAAKTMEMREKDGATARNAYRPITEPGKYTITAATVGYWATDAKPFVMENAEQFRPGPPPDLRSDTWARDYNEIKEIGEKYSTKRTPQQTETARLWLAAGPIGYNPWVRQIAIAKNMSVIDTARFMALVTIAEADAIQSVFAAKWHYLFWRPMTAIRNGDIDGNAATERNAIWEPLDTTPLHPEYPCAHCILSGAVTTVIQKVIGSAEIPEVSISSPTAPGVVHKATNVIAIADEISLARIYAGFHYRNSTEVGRAMGQKIGEYVVTNALQPM
jgi:PAP2 superfamily